MYIYNIKSTYLYTVDLLEKISNCHVGCLIGRRVYICGLNLTNKVHVIWIEDGAVPILTLRLCNSHEDNLIHIKRTREIGLYSTD